MLSIPWVLALFTLLTLSAAVYFAAKKIHVPYTVLLVAVGIVLALIVNIPILEPYVGFIDDIRLTPELLFYLFLPVLIFESAYNMNIRKIVESAWSVTLLSVVGLLISALVIASLLYFIFPFLGLSIPFIVCLLFASIISATDPVAVLSLFKEFGAPKRLTLIFEGESLFNDGTAVALFFVVLAIAVGGFHGATTIFEGVAMFTIMVVGGIVFGLFMALLFSKALRYTRSNEFVSVLLLIISAHFTFILCELINEHGYMIGNIEFKLSSIIATTITALFLGNYSRHILSPQSESYIEKFVGHIAFVINSLVFILIGILFIQTNVSVAELWLPIVVTVLVVAFARAVSIYSVIIPFNTLGLEERIPKEWQHLLSWGSLRGALAIIVAFLIPTDLQIDGWTAAFTPQEFVLALIIGCILATLFIKAVTIGPMMRKFKVTDPTPVQRAHYIDLASYYLHTERVRFEEQNARGFIDTTYYESLKAKVEDMLQKIKKEQGVLVEKYGAIIFEQSLNLAAIDIEEKYLKELYSNEEVCEKVYRRIKGKLTVQREKIEAADHLSIDESLCRDRKDVFDNMMAAVQALFDKKGSVFTVQNQFEYYRAQAIMARKVVKTLRGMQEQYGTSIFIPEVFERVLALYDSHRVKANARMDKIMQENTQEIHEHMMYLSQKALYSSGNKAIRYLEDKGILSEADAEHIKHVYRV